MYGLDTDLEQIDKTIQSKLNMINLNLFDYNRLFWLTLIQFLYSMLLKSKCWNIYNIGMNTIEDLISTLFNL